jgi:signal transduction histidine kinase
MSDPALQQVDPGRDASGSLQDLESENRAMRRLVAAVQELSLARDLGAVMAIVRRAARELTGADGATFILRDEEQCHYADEDAIAPLWKGERFPMSACVGGWTMLNQKPAVIEDIYADPRVPIDAYRATFVKSLVLVPIRAEAPIGAIGTYWALRHLASPAQVELLQTLANTTAVAMESVQLLAELEQRVHERTLQLEATNRELEAFAYSVSHDLKAPLRAISGFADLLAAQEPKLDEKSKHFLSNVRTEASRMNELIEDLLRLARLSRTELRRARVDLSALAHEVGDQLKAAAPERHVELRVEPGLTAHGDAGLLRAVLQNLLSNAWKYTSKKDSAVIEVGARAQADGTRAFFVKDDGAGFDMQYAGKLFAPFQRMHRQEDYPGHGVGLATVQRIVHRHGGRAWTESEPGKGATFLFTLPPPPAGALPFTERRARP